MRRWPFWDEEAPARVEAGRPCVVLAGSGMCDGGRIVNYFKAMLGQSRNDVVFVGYQAEGTPGRDILRGGAAGARTPGGDSLRP